MNNLLKIYFLVLILFESMTFSINALPLAKQKSESLMLQTQVGIQSSLYNLKDGQYSNYSTIAQLFMYKSDFGLSGFQMGYNFSNQNNQDSDFEDLRFFHALRDKTLNSELSLKQTGLLILPFSKHSQYEKNLSASILLAEKIIYQPVLIKKLSLELNLSIGKNFHKFNLSESGSPLVNYFYQLGIGVNYLISNSVNASINSQYTQSKSYQNSTFESYTISESIQYEFSERFSISLTHSNGGNPIRANGQDYNIEIINDQSSTLSAEISLNW